MKPLLETLSTSLKEDGSDANLKRWIAFIIENKIALTDHIALIYAEYPIALRFSWMLGGMCEIEPEIVAPIVPYLFRQRQDIEIPHFNRSLAKFFYHCGIPDELEGEATDALFKWLGDPASNVSTKRIALLALVKLSKKYPELVSELKLMIEELDGKCTPAFDKLAGKMLERLQ